MKKTTGLLLILTLLLASCNSSTSESENGDNTTQRTGDPTLGPIDVYIFIEKKDVPLEKVEITLKDSKGTKIDTKKTDACGMAKFLNLPEDCLLDITSPDIEPIKDRKVDNNIIRFSLK